MSNVHTFVDKQTMEMRRHMITRLRASGVFADPDPEGLIVPHTDPRSLLATRDRQVALLRSTLLDIAKITTGEAKERALAALRLTEPKV